MFTKLCQARVNLFRRAKLIILFMFGLTFGSRGTRTSEYLGRGVSSVASSIASSAKEIFGQSRSKTMSEADRKRTEEAVARKERDWDRKNEKKSKSQKGQGDSPKETQGAPDTQA